jgi:hypothetical protein
MIVLQIIFAFIFYTVFIYGYLYSIGKVPIRHENRYKYLKWRDVYGKGSSRICLYFLILYTILLIITIF